MNPEQRRFYNNLTRPRRAPFRLHTQPGPLTAMIEARRYGIAMAERILAIKDPQMPSGRRVLTQNQRAKMTARLEEMRDELDQLYAHEKSMAGKWERPFKKSPAQHRHDTTEDWG